MVQRHEDAAGPTYSSDHDHAGTAGTSLVDHGHSEVTGPAASEPAAPETPAPLVVARSAESPTPLPAGRPDSGDSDSAVEDTGAGQAATLGAGETSVGSTGGASPAPEAAVPAPAAPSMSPLTVPVQRSATSSGAAPGSTAAPGHVGDVSSPATLRPVSSTPPTVAVPAATQPADTGQSPPTPIPTPATELVVARSAAEPATQRSERQPDQQPADDLSPTAIELDPSAGDAAVTGLLSSRPLVESSSVEAGPPPGDAPAGDTAPLTVPSGTIPTQGPGPTLQRQFTDQPPATRPAGSTPVLSSVVTSAVSSGPASTAGSLPSGPTAPTGSPTAGLDDQGYPPLIARSVQRSTVGTDEAGRAPGLSAATPMAGDVPIGPQAPLSGFSAAISALQDPPPGPPLGGDSETADGTGGSNQDPPLVVARRVAPDQTGHLPTPDVHLQRVVTTGPPAAPPTLVQRSLIAGGPPLTPPPATLGSGVPTTSAPAVQRLRYEGGVPSETHLILDQAAEADGQPSTGELDVPAMEMPTAPASAAWSPVAPAPPAGSGSSAWSSSPGPSTAEPPRSGASRAMVQRSAAETSPAVVGTTAYPRSGEPPAPMVSPPMAAADPTPMIQRRFDAPSPSTAVAPPVSADPPAMAVSGRTVGLAEMFAMAAAQSSDGGATIQRSAETEVQLAADPPAAAPAAAPSAAPAGPAGPAAPMNGAELEEMARRLYEPLTARLRAELWQDRERSGLLTDLRP